MRAHLPLLFLLTATALTTLCQQNLPQGPDTPLGTVDTILISGNEKTKDYVIFDEMTLRKGAVVTPTLLEYDRKRIYSLGLFTRVDLWYDSLGTIRFLFVDVRERWYFVPFPTFGFRDGDPKRPYYGAGVLHTNVAGRNQKLYAAFTLGADPSASLSFLDPLLHRGASLYGGISLSYSHPKNKSSREAALTGNYSEDHFNLSGTLGKRFSLHETAGITLGYSSVKVPDYYPGRTANSSGLDKFLWGTLSFTHDSRDLVEYATRGLFTGLSVTQNGFGESAVSYTRTAADVRTYLPLGGGFSLASRVFGSMMFGGDVPTYGRTYFGYSERIRGFYNEVAEGEDLILLSSELRLAVLPARTIQVSGLPIPEEFTVWRFGISFALFADAGTTWFRGEPLDLRGFCSGAGAGIHFLLPYSAVARLEYARNSTHHGEWILGFRSAI
jgi:outer membrane protein assembly factor BamA